MVRSAAMNFADTVLKQKNKPNLSTINTAKSVADGVCASTMEGDLCFYYVLFSF